VKLELALSEEIRLLKLKAMKIGAYPEEAEKLKLQIERLIEDKK